MHAPRPLKYFDEGRSATWLELFFDLIFVVGISKVTHILTHTHHGHLEVGAWWKVPLMMLPIWWIWMAHTLWANLFDRDDQSHRFMTLLVMLQMIILSTTLTTDWETAYPLFNLSYFGLRITFAILYLLERNSHPHYASLATERSAWMILAASISLCSFIFPAPLRYLVFYIGLGIEIMIPLIQGRAGKFLAVHGEHFVERMGLLIIILMGESIISLSSGLDKVEWSAQSITAGVMGAILIGAAWWIYFDSYHRLAHGEGKPCSGLLLAYPHFLTCLSLAIIANVIYHAIHPGLDRTTYQLMAMCGMVTFYSGKQIPYYVKFPIVRINIIINTAITLAIAAGALLLKTNTAILSGLTLSLLAYVCLNLTTAIPKLRRIENGGITL
jgi:low temperature requirement protein LtrA